MDHTFQNVVDRSLANPTDQGSQRTKNEVILWTLNSLIPFVTHFYNYFQRSNSNSNPK